MRRVIWGLIAFALVAVLSFGALSGAWLADYEKASANSVRAAVLDLVALNGSFTVDLGEVRPGDAGLIKLDLRNSGTIPGILEISSLADPPKYLGVSFANPCSCEIGAGGSLTVEISWELPDEANDTGLDNQSFEFSYQLVFENGFRVVRVVKVIGKVSDPLDPTHTPPTTETPTATSTASTTPAPPSGEVIEGTVIATIDPGGSFITPGATNTAEGGGEEKEETVTPAISSTLATAEIFPETPSPATLTPTSETEVLVPKEPAPTETSIPTESLIETEPALTEEVSETQTPPSEGL